MREKISRILPHRSSVESGSFNYFFIFVINSQFWRADEASETPQTSLSLFIIHTTNSYFPQCLILNLSFQRAFQRYIYLSLS